MSNIITGTCSDGVLAIDFGTLTGWAKCIDDQITTGMKNLGEGSRSHKGSRFLKYNNWLNLQLSCGKISTVVYEDVKAHKGTAAAHCYGAFKYITQMICYKYRIEFIEYGVGTIKKFATGKGNALKQEMVQAAPPHIQDDNEADAYHILMLHLHHSRQ